MSKKRILIVEDEWVIANDIEIRLQDMGYEVLAIVSTGKKAIAKAQELQPDLVLMDIKLNGEIDGIEAASQIYSQFYIPFVFLTAFSDKKTLERAKIAEPFGYLIKPFKERELQIAIEIALYKHAAEKKLKESQEWLSTTFNSICDAVVTIDAKSLITYMNRHAISLTGWTAEEALGRPLNDIFCIITEDTGREAGYLANMVLVSGQPITSISCISIPKGMGSRKDNIKMYVEGSAAPIKDNMGGVVGAILIFRDVTQERLIEERVRLAERLAALGRMSAGVAHEINTPLTGIIMFSSIMLNRLSPDNADDRESLELIIESAQRCSRIVNGLLRFSSTITSNRIDVNVNAIIEALLEDLYKPSDSIT